MSSANHATLSAIDLFAGLPAGEIANFAKLAIRRSYDPKETLFEEGETCQGIWIIASGVVRIYKLTPGGRQVVLAMQPAPGTVAEVPVFDGGPYPATVIAQEPSEAMLILKEDFLAACRRNPELGLRFLRVFGARLRQLVGLVERITFGSVRQRLATMLLESADAAGGAEFTLADTHEEIANQLGTVREVVSRNLGRFQGEGLIRVQRREVAIIDRPGLEVEAATNF